MPTRETVPVRMYTDDLEHLLLTRGTGTPADALRKIIKTHKQILELTKENFP